MPDKTVRLSGAPWRRQMLLLLLQRVDVTTVLIGGVVDVLTRVRTEARFSGFPGWKGLGDTLAGTAK